MGKDRFRRRTSKPSLDYQLEPGFTFNVTNSNNIQHLNSKNYSGGQQFSAKPSENRRRLYIGFCGPPA